MLGIAAQLTREPLELVNSGTYAAPQKGQFVLVFDVGRREGHFGFKAIFGNVYPDFPWSLSQ